MANENSIKKKTSNENRKNLIDKVMIEGYNVKDAAFLCNMSYFTAANIIRIFKNEGRTEKKRTGMASNKKVTDEMEVYVEKVIEDNPLLTLIQIREKVHMKFEILLSIETIRRIIINLKITLKKVSLTSININSNNTKSRRHEYARKYMELGDDIIKIFIDESGFNLYLRRTLGRSVRGSVVSTIVPSNRGINVSLISAISRTEVLYAKTITGSVNAQIFTEYMETLIQRCNEKGILNSCVFILDNARIHHAEITKHFFNERAINVLFLSPYSYMLNPIEFSFSKIKANVRRSLSDGYNGSFHDLILNSVNQITESDLDGYYRHIQNNCIKAIANEDFN